MWVVEGEGCGWWRVRDAGRVVGVRYAGRMVGVRDVGRMVEGEGYGEGGGG